MKQIGANYIGFDRKFKILKKCGGIVASGKVKQQQPEQRIWIFDSTTKGFQLPCQYLYKIYCNHPRI
jgi:hypothetical protein